MQEKEASVVNPKTIVTAVLVLAISASHYVTAMTDLRPHVVLRELYYLPIILSGLWFGMKGGLGVSGLIVLLYAPMIILNWSDLAAVDLERILECGLFITVGLLTGLLRDREQAKESQRAEQVAALAGTVAHEINSPLFAALSAAQMLEEDLEDQSKEDVGLIIRNLMDIKEQVRKISGIKDVILQDYAGNTQVATLGGEE
ncbi:DUF4118 domain-containing protein [Pseudodesulfovibrio cashew]|uniref:histidine kinase n=1 Tax=Pseudodesulfovibrio cashew TaxID=2678688 RepID=A0A6I6JF16_9BACT|nr:DUF4118 domain-containing protein [Pseudodesulfovibrio cashew]QGY41436.1 DUF4118 domain-containing protein [Pseudodesulfovibrio cashew]